MNLLFVCSRNLWRSPTAEAINKNQSEMNVKSAGTEPSARIRINSSNIKWSDIIFVMEKKHKQRIIAKFPIETHGKTIINLDIPDEYNYMDEELVEEIKSKVNKYIE